MQTKLSCDTLSGKYQIHADIPIVERTNRLLEEHRQQLHRKCDGLFASLMIVEWIGGIITAVLWSPKTWAGTYSDTHIHVTLALWWGMAIISLPIFLAIKLPGRTVTRHVIAAGQMVLTALLIHLSGGRIETHFLVFGSLAFLAFYRDWRVLITASLVVVVDHLLRGVFLPQSVYGVLTPEPWRVVEHAAWVCFADVFFIGWCIESSREMLSIARKRAQLEASNYLVEKEVVLRTVEARASEERFRTLCQSAPITIFETDSNGRWIFVGERWSHLTGRPLSDALDSGWQDALHPEDRAAAGTEWSNAITLGTGWNCEFRILLPSNEVRWVRGIAVRSRNTPDSGDRLIGTLEDITEHRQMEEASRRMLLMEQRDDFMATLTHDLKNPLIGTNRILNLVLDGSLGPITTSHSEVLRVMKDTHTSLLGMIQTLIGAYRLDSANYELQAEEFDVVELVDSCIREVKPLLEERQVEIICAEEAIAGLADKSAIYRVIRNLLDNAIKFSPSQGKISVKIEKQAGTWAVEVFNSESYLSPSAIARLFKRFWHGENGQQYSAGTGLGLYICSQIVQAHRGTISCRSDEKLGTTFTVVIPDAQAAKAANARTSR